ncbi:hypothetical protein CMQ_5187 [Grosmannia clavigera kw1407]|uniref:Uncharacterized protein n=1 Tax=Grosmannia clavigera (strain kw1407 / UAMH 11150) TaxID=655863 RepID=F0XBF1_GROCL|nr:uncharacterized protein CMQ_5187 [Grosmannia clavigera kw1407]EFX04925.1 hypothetical protein CMQ_5187 [Grosmannia clavigera kw1407]
MTEIVAPPLGYFLMNRLGPHFAFLVGIPIEALTLVAIAFLPSTIQSTLDREVQQPLLSSDSIEDVEEPRSNATGGLVQKVQQLLQDRRLRQDVSSRALERSLLGGLLALVVAKMARPIF